MMFCYRFFMWLFITIPCIIKTTLDITLFFFLSKMLRYTGYFHISTGKRLLFWCVICGVYFPYKMYIVCTGFHHKIHGIVKKKMMRHFAMHGGEEGHGENCKILGRGFIISLIILCACSDSNTVKTG